jgi:hypothetical protein
MCMFMCVYVYIYIYIYIYRETFFNLFKIDTCACGRNMWTIAYLHPSIGVTPASETKLVSSYFRSVSAKHKHVGCKMRARIDMVRNFLFSTRTESHSKDNKGNFQTASVKLLSSKIFSVATGIQRLCVGPPPIRHKHLTSLLTCS